MLLLLHRLCLRFHPSAATTKPQIYISKSQKKKQIICTCNFFHEHAICAYFKVAREETN